jgi:Ca2+-binding EF-hand superfamily protein
LGIQDLLELFMKIGYSIAQVVIEDAMKVVLPEIYKKGLWRDYKMVFEDVLQLFHLIRKREGFSDKEVAELTEVFNRHDDQGQGELREFELARCLNWLGYPLSAQRRHELWCRVDVDKTESIELGEFLKLIRILREEETSGVRQALIQCEKAGSKTHMPEPILKGMLLKLGYSPPQTMISQAVKQSGDHSGDGQVDLQGALGILRFIREKQVAKLRQNAGLCDQQAAKLRAKCGLRLDAGKPIEIVEFERVMYELFPVARSEQCERDKIRALIKQHAKGSGIHDLMEAFWIVRHYSDMREEDKWRREQQAARDAGFTNWQVASFREAFVAADINSDGCLTEREIQAVFDDLCSLNLTQVENMRQEFYRLGDKKEYIEFAEFLSLMKIILWNSKSG